MTGAGGARRLAWKESIDLSRPLVPSSGHLDPLDLLVNLIDLRAATIDVQAERWPDLEAPIAEAATLCAGVRWATDDALGIGGLLLATVRLARRVAAGESAWRSLLAALVADSVQSLAWFGRGEPLRLPATVRLGFRELGLAIGLHGVERLAARAELAETVAGGATALREAVPLAARIEATWSDPAARREPSWSEHRDIDEVMLATSLAPAGYLGF